MPPITENEARRYLAEFDPLPGEYQVKHLRRFVESLHLIPEGKGQLLEIGCDNHFSLLLQRFTRYQIQTQNLPPQKSSGTGYSPTASFVHRQSGRKIEFVRDEFDPEADRFPYADGRFDVVVCMEVIEHLLHDPMAMLIEVHRVLKPNGVLVLTTPNLISWHSILKAIRGINPLCYSFFLRDYSPPLLQHAKEYMTEEVREMLESSGFGVERLFTPYFPHQHERFRPADWLLLAFLFLWFPLTLRNPRALLNRGTLIFIVARKIGPLKNRYPPQIYL